MCVCVCVCLCACVCSHHVCHVAQVLRGIASKHSTSIADVASRWVLQRRGVPAIVLGARNPDHVADHRALFSFQLDAQDLGAIDEVLSKGQRAKGDCYDWERGGRW